MTLQKTFHQKFFLVQITEMMRIHIHGNAIIGLYEVCEQIMAILS